MRRLTYLFLVIMICLALLAGCSQVEPQKTNAPTGIHLSRSSMDLPSLPPTNFSLINNLDGVTMQIKKGTVTPAGLTVVFKNESKKKCIFGDFFKLEKKISGKWYQVPVTIKGDYAFNSLGYELASGANWELPVDWQWIYGSLPNSNYRIVKDICDFRGPGDFDNYYLAAEFEIH